MAGWRDGRRLLLLTLVAAHVRLERLLDDAQVVLLLPQQFFHIGIGAAATTATATYR
jgi:hypothetical protein